MASIVSLTVTKIQGETLSSSLTKGFAAANMGILNAESAGTSFQYRLNGDPVGKAIEVSQTIAQIVTLSQDSVSTVTFGDGTAAAPTMTWDSDIDLGFYRVGANEQGFTAGGTGQFKMTDGTIEPITDSDVDLGTTGARFKDLYIDTITSTNQITGATIEATGDTSAGDNAAMGYTATEGLILTGQGSTNDVTIKNDADADVISIPTGTTTPTIADDTTLTTGTIILADGGTVTQATNRTTGVTLNTHSGQITTNNASLAAGAEATFTVTNTVVTALDTIIVNAASGQTAGTSIPTVTAVASGSFDITLTNLHASTADTGAMVINFVVLRGASS